MATQITVPKLGLTMTEATLVKWTVDAGRKVSREDIVAVIETDKVSFEIVAPDSGWIYPVIEVDTVVAVSQTIGYIAADEAELRSLQKAEPKTMTEAAVSTNAVHKNTAAKVGAAEEKPEGRIIASPLARRMANEHGLDLASIAGSGPGGRIVESDIEAALTAPPAAESAPAGAARQAQAPAGELLTVAEKIPIQGVRKVIFNKMHTSLSTQAQLTLQTESSAMGMLAIRDLLNRAKGADGPTISYNAILIKTVASALRKHPVLNSMVDDDTVKIWNEIHVGLAMDIGGGLIVPKVRFADTKSIADISLEIEVLMEKAERKALGPDDLQGGTFTITNLGAWGVDHFTPIINYPESAILGVGRMIEKPCAVAGEVKIETRMSLSLTFDHRIIDGAPAAAFFKTLTQMIEDPRLML